MSIVVGRAARWASPGILVENPMFGQHKAIAFVDGALLSVHAEQLWTGVILQAVE
jgi:hypothetical protein